MERDFVGYGNRLPKAAWPHEAQLAISFVLNYEEGAERNVLDGDTHSENYLIDLPGAPSLEGERHLSSESLFEYGSRAGVWRLLRLFAEANIPLTVFAAGLALERNPALAAALRESAHEVAGHGYRWINYGNVPLEEEMEHIRKTLDAIRRLTGKQPLGWYTGRKSAYTRQLLVKEGLLYDSDGYADDLPYWVEVTGKQHLVVPYALDTNDLRYATAPGWNTGGDFFNYLKGCFDCLYCEGASAPRMMSIGLHPRLSGHPGRSDALRQFIDYVLSFKRVWLCRREEIARHWISHHPPN